MQDHVVMCRTMMQCAGPCCDVQDYVVMLRTVCTVQTCVCVRVVQVQTAERERAAVAEQLTNTHSTLTRMEQEADRLNSRLQDTARKLAEAQVPVWIGCAHAHTHTHARTHTLI